MGEEGRIQKQEEDFTAVVDAALPEAVQRATVGIYACHFGDFFFLSFVFSVTEALGLYRRDKPGGRRWLRIHLFFLKV